MVLIYEKQHQLVNENQVQDHQLMEIYDENFYKKIHKRFENFQFRQKKIIADHF